MEMEIDKKSSHAGNRTRIGRVRACYPNQLDYMGFVSSRSAVFMRGVIELLCSSQWSFHPIILHTMIRNVKQRKH